MSKIDITENIGQGSANNAIPADEQNQEEVKQDSVEESKTEEKEMKTPSELPAEEKSAEENPEEDNPSEEIADGEVNKLQQQLTGLTGEKSKLLGEIRELRNERRGLKGQDTFDVKQEQKVDELKDVHPEDIALIEKVNKAKGYTSKEEVELLLYDRVEQEQISSFLEKYPEYKPENDTSDTKWENLQQEVSLYRKPSDPSQVKSLLLKAHNAISKPNLGGQSAAIKKKQIETAGMGGGGKTQRSFSQKSFSPVQKEMMSRGGYTEKEIKELEGKLS